MSDRRRARGDHTGEGRPRYLGNELPAHLASGPCIEDWISTTDHRPAHLPSSVPWPAFRALRNWQRAVEEWATQTGWATQTRPASNARNLARVRTPWSRDFLIEQGEEALVAYFEGRRARYPGRDRHGWDVSTDATPVPTPLLTTRKRA